MTSRTSRAFVVSAAATALLVVAACVPEIDDRSFLVTKPTLLAISSTPAEAAPPAEITYQALVVDPDGGAPASLTGDLAWAFCIAREALTDEGTVSPLCLATGGSNLVPLGDGVSAQGALPADGCRLFGPDRPDTTGTAPAGRPVDPDETGGYYQPVRLLSEDPDAGIPTSIGATRIACGLDSAPAMISTAFTAGYRMNEAPNVETLTILRADGSSETLPPNALTVKAGEAVTLRAAWTSCPTTPVCGDGVCGVAETITSCPKDCTTPKGCAGSEQYLLFDPTSRTLTDAREAIRVAWYTTGGSLANDTTGQTADQADTPFTDDAWTAPSTPGTVLLWLVVRDDRGGVGWQSYVIDVQ